MSRERRGLVFVVGGLVCFFFIRLVAGDCGGNESVRWVLSVLGILSGAFCVAAATFLYAGTPTRRWVPWAAAFVMFMLATVGFAFLAGGAVASNCAR